MRNSYLHNLMPSPGPQTHLTEPQRWFFNYRTNERTAFRQHYSTNLFLNIKTQNIIILLTWNCEIGLSHYVRFHVTVEASLSQCTSNRFCRQGINLCRRQIWHQQASNDLRAGHLYLTRAGAWSHLGKLTPTDALQASYTDSCRTLSLVLRQCVSTRALIVPASVSE